jgi:hypothetical protein
MWIVDAHADQAASTVAHEMSHFVFHAFSPYGFCLDEIWAEEVGCVSRIAHGLMGVFKYVPYPVYEVARAMLRDTDQLPSALCDQGARELVEKFAKPWSHLEALHRILEGGPGVNDYLVADVIKWVEEFESSASNSFDRSTPSPIPARSDADVPPAFTAGVGGNPGVPIGGHNVFEGIAQHAELSPPTAEHIRQHEDYWIIHLWTIAEYCKKYGNASSKEDYERIRDTFLALCDLSLFTPLGGLYGSLRRAGNGWLDLQPGHRFAAAMRATSHVGWLNFLDGECEAFQNSICDLLGWPRPRAFLELGADLKSDANWVTRHRDACRLRLEDFEAPLEWTLDLPPNDSVKSLFMAHTPICSWRGVTRIDRERTAEQLVTYFLSAWSDAVMRLASFHYNDLLPENVDWTSFAIDGRFQGRDGFLENLTLLHAYLAPSSLVLWKHVRD